MTSPQHPNQTMTSPRARIAAALHNSARILLVNHVEPDGDTLGSTLALALALESLGKMVIVASEGGVPPAFAFLPGADRVVRDLPPAPLIIAIDHHESHIPYGHLEDWDPAAAAAAEQVADLIRALGVPLSPAIASALLTGLATDTGVFRFPTVRPHSLRLAAELMEAGAPLAEIVAAVYEQRPLSANRLLGYALLRTAVAADGAVAYSTLSEAVQRAAGALPDDGAGIVGALRTMKGVKVAILFEENGDDVRVSIRTRDGVRANAIAETFGGGGHPGAAGCTLPGPLADAVPQVLAAAETELRRNDRVAR